MIIDNANWFLPSHSYSPNSRIPALGPEGLGWAEVADVSRRVAFDLD